MKEHDNSISYQVIFIENEIFRKNKNDNTLYKLLSFFLMKAYFSLGNGAIHQSK